MIKDNDYIPMEELTNYHQQIVEKYKNLKPEEIVANPDNTALMAFNGYYAMEHAKGAFFTVDTNIFVQAGLPPIHDLTLLISLDGRTCERYEFTGTFDGANLKQVELGGINIDLTFLREDAGNGNVASFTGSITPNLQPLVIVSGSTYNNPIPLSMYKGVYCIPLYLSTKKNAEVPVMEIHDKYKLSYDYGTNDGHLQPVPAYTYNMNMYFFSFKTATQTIKLIMGTACAGGLVANNMIVDNSTNHVTSRSIQTILFPEVESSKELPNIMSGELAKYSGYYKVPSIAKNAFVSIQAEYVVFVDGFLEINKVLIGVSLDGITSKGYSFIAVDDMKFENNTLSMPNQSINITFNRGYDSVNGSLVTITGSVMGHQIVDGYTLFNPVPLSGFGGATMTNAKNDALTVVSDTEVIYNGTTMKNIIYVPIMYILANPADKPTTEMSFGTDGLKGNTCIVTDHTGICAVYAIP
ncbi:MAG: hypothetical protein GY710_18780 [Desulfobacteraceae bacterium]|nr:hypothetical protein [Desulfobacteraceae bacterium]